MKSKIGLTMLFVVGVSVLLYGCDQAGSAEEKSVPTFCPTPMAQSLEVAPETGNVPPRAYYQELTTGVNTPLSVTLYACDPNDATTSEGLSWRQPALGGEEGPANGTLSAYSGTYPEGGIITYTPAFGFTGMDSFTYLVDDGEAEGNMAEIIINVSSVEPGGSSLYFGGWDNPGTYQLWSLNSSGILATVPGGSSAITNSYGDIRDTDVLGERLFLIVDIGDGGGAVYSYNQESGFMTHLTSSFYQSNMVVMNDIVYIGDSDAGGYLWAADEAGSMTTLTGTAGIYADEVAGYGGTLFFSGDYAGYPQLWTRNGSGILETHSNMTMGLNPAHFTYFNNDIYFAGDTDISYKHTLWRFNGSSPIITVGSLDLALLWTLDGASALAVLDSLLCINGADSSGIYQLWTYHPAGGFNALTNNTVYDVSPLYMAVYEGRLFFNGIDDSGQSRLYYTDGVTVNPVPGTGGLNPRFMTVYENRLFFAGGSYPDIQLWYIDPAFSTPTRVTSISTVNGEGGLNPSGLVVF